MKYLDFFCIKTLFWVFLLGFVEQSFGATKYGRASGNWSSTTVWSNTSGGATGATIPVSGDIIIIENGTINFDVTNLTILNLTINAGAALNLGGTGQDLTITGNTAVNGILNDGLNGGTTTFGGNLTVGASGNFRTTVGGANVYNFIFQGNITNNGGFDLSIGITNYTFNTAPLTITPNATMRFASTNVGSGTVDANVTIANGNGDVELFGNGSTGPRINGGVTLTNQNGGAGVLITNYMDGGSGTSNFTNTTNAVLKYRATAMPMPTGIFNVNTVPNKVIYDLAGGQNIKPTTYHDLEVIGGGIKSLVGNTTVNGTLLINASTTLEASSNSLTVGGVTTIDGTFADGTLSGTNTFASITISSSGSYIDNTISGGNAHIFDGVFTNGGSFTNSTGNSSSYTFRQNITNSGTFDLQNSGTTIFAINPITITPTVTMSFPTGSTSVNINVTIANGQPVIFRGNVTVANTRTLLNNISTTRLVIEGTLNAAGTSSQFTNGANAVIEYRGDSAPMSGGLLTVNASGNTFEYARTSAPPQSVAGGNYHHIFLNNTGANKSLSNNVVIDGNITIGSGVTFNGNSNDINLKGNWTNYGTFIAGTTGSITFAGTTNSQTIEGSTIFNDVTINNLYATAPTITLLSGGSNDIDIISSLDLLKGRIVLNDNDLTMFSGASLLLAVTPSDSYIETNNIGKFTRQSLVINTQQFFPIGDAVSLKMVSCSLTVSNDVGMRYIAGGVSGGFAPPAGAYDISSGRWQIDATIDLKNIRFHAPGNSIVQSMIQKYNGTFWQQLNTDIPQAFDYITEFGANIPILSSANFAIFNRNTPIVTATTNVTKTGFTVNWEALPGMDGYKLDVSTKDDFSSGFILNDVDAGNALFYNVNSGIVVNKKYYYRVRGYKTSPSINTGNSNTKITSTILPAGSGKTLVFTGGNGHLTTETPPNFDVSYGVTIEAWVNLAYPPAFDKSIVEMGKTSNDGFGLFIQGGGTPRIGARADGTKVVFPIACPIGQWTHITIVHAMSGDIELWVNGVSQGFETAPNLTNPTEGITIGMDTYDVNSNFVGKIDEVRTWNKSLTTTDVRTNMCKKLIGNESDLKAYFRFDENGGTITENKAVGSRYDAVFVNSVFWDMSNAPLGDISVPRYGYTDGTLTDTDIFSINNVSGSPVGFHIYKIKEAPNHITPPNVYGTMLDSRYWGVFVAGGTNPKFDITYSYVTNAQVTKPNALRFARRTEVNDSVPPVWLPYGGINSALAKKVLRRQAEAGEFILAQKNFTISNALNGGTVAKINDVGTKVATASNPLLGNDFTIEFWCLNANNTPDGNDTKWVEGKRIITFENGVGNSDFGVTLMDDGTNNFFAFGVRDNTGTATTIKSTAPAINDTWYHVAVTRQGKNMYLYVNGKQVDFTTLGTTDVLSANANFKLGADLVNTPASMWKGYIDEVRIWDTNLAEDDIKDWMNLRAHNGHSNYINLVAYYRFDENDATALKSEDLIDGEDMTFNVIDVFANANQALGDGYVDNQVVPNTDGAVVSFGTMVNADTPQVEVTFGSGANPTPDGKLVCTRVSAAPNNYPPSSGSIGGGNVTNWSGITNFMNCYWVIRNYGNNQTFDPINKIKFQIPTGNTVNILNSPSSLLLFKRPTNSTSQTDWRLVGVGTAWGSIEFAAGGPTDIDQWSELIIGSSSTPLGVTLTEFKGKRLDDKMIHLEWKTLQEKENAGFEIQRSTDGQNFTQIGFLEGEGNTTTIQSYSFMDNKAEGNFYYRLLQTDRDGTSFFTPIIFIKAETTQQELTLYPNPASKELKINVSGAVNGTMRAEVWDIQGKLVWESKGNLKELENSLNKQLEAWKEGVYVFKLYSPEKMLERKFIKRK